MFSRELLVFRRVGWRRSPVAFEVQMFSDETDKDVWVRKEKEKARLLRKTHWWNNRVAPGVCHYCGRNVGREKLTMDHLVPLSRGDEAPKGISLRHARSAIPTRNICFLWNGIST
jgi:hypothetical protein